MAALVFYILVAILGYTYLGYPIVLYLLSFSKKTSVCKDEKYIPSVTLLVAAYNEDRVIEDKARNCLKLKYPKDKLRIIIASDGSTDRTNVIVGKYKDEGIELIAFKQNRGKPSVINDVMKRIDSEIVVFSDANVMYGEESLHCIVRNFADRQVGAVTGRVTLINNNVSYGFAENNYYVVEYSIYKYESMTGSVVGADGAMYAIRRELFKELHPDTILDDFVISMTIAREGHLVLFEPDALGFEENLNDIGKELNRKIRIISGGMQCIMMNLGLPKPSDTFLMCKFISHKLLRWMSGYILFALVINLGYLSVFSSAGRVLWRTLAAVFSGIVSLAVIAQAFPSCKAIKVLNFIHYFFVMNIASLIGVVKGLLQRQKVTWKRV